MKLLSALRRRWVLSLFALFVSSGVISQTTKALWVGETFMCDATSAILGSPTDISWSTSGGYISLSGSGLYRNVTATQYWSGIATVKCTWRYTLYYGGPQSTGSRTWTFTCQENPLRLSPTSITMNVGETRYVTFGHTYTNSYSSYAQPYLSCSGSCVSVSSDGMVKALSPGTAYINVYSKLASSTNSPYCLVTVKESAPTGISISPSTRQSLAINSYKDFTYTLTPTYATTSVTWSLTGDTNAATLSSSGRLTGRAEGTVCVRVSTSNGYSDYCYVDIYKPVPSSITMNNDSREVNVPVGGARTLNYTVTPSNAIYEVSWQSDNPEVAAVSQSGMVTTKKPGTAHITVTTDNGKQATATVTVPPQPSVVTIEPQAIELLMGRQKQLSYKFTPTNAMANSMTWSSSDNNVATVSSAGVVSARRPGTVQIFVTCNNGVKGQCKLTVPMPLFQLFVWMKNGEKTGYLSTDKPEIRLDGENVKFSTDALAFDIKKEELDKFTLEQVLPEHPVAIDVEDEIKVGLGQKRRVVYSLTPSDAQTEITWLNSNPDVIAVAYGGWISGLKVGSSTLRAQTSNGLRATCLVTVPEPAHKFYVWLRNGVVRGYAIEDKPSVTMGGELFTLTAGDVTVGYAAKDVIKFTLEDSAVNDPATEVVSLPEAQSEMTSENGELIFSNLRAGSSVFVYSLKGQLTDRFLVPVDGALRVPLQAYLSGIYIVKTEKSTYKILKK